MRHNYERSACFIDGALATADLARTLITRLLSFARKRGLESRDIFLRRLLLGAVDLIGRSVGPIVQIHLEDLTIYVDTNQLELALLSLTRAMPCPPAGH